MNYLLLDEQYIAMTRIDLQVWIIYKELTMQSCVTMNNESDR